MAGEQGFGDEGGARFDVKEGNMSIEDQNAWV